MHKNLCSILVVSLLFSPLSARAATISFGTDGIVDLLPNTNNQVVYVDITGGEITVGVNFNLSIGDGGQIVGGVNGGKPLLRDARITGTAFHSGIDHEPLVFSYFNTGEYALDLRLVMLPPTNPPTAYIAQTSTSAPAYVESTDAFYGNALEGHLAVLLIDTTGFDALAADQLFLIRATVEVFNDIAVPRFFPTQLFDSHVNLIPLTLTDGYLRIRGIGGPPAAAEGPAIPEPAAMVLAGAGAILLAVAIGRRRGCGPLGSNRQFRFG